VCAVYLPIEISVDFGPTPSFDGSLSFSSDPFFPHELPKKAHFQCSIGPNFWNRFLLI
jgi:hypothetical protein